MKGRVTRPKLLRALGALQSRVHAIPESAHVCVHAGAPTTSPCAPQSRSNLQACSSHTHA